MTQTCKESGKGQEASVSGWEKEEASGDQTEGPQPACAHRIAQGSSVPSTGSKRP